MSYIKETKFKKTEIGTIPEDWEIKELNEIGEIVTGKTPPTKNKEYFGKLVPFITPRDMTSNKFIKSTERYLSKEGKILLKNIVLPENSICVSCIGSDMGKVAINKYESITNQQINAIIPKNLNYNFVYYSIFLLKKELKNLAYHSTAIPILNKSQFSKIKICIPSIESEINKISEVLSYLDDKIELSNKINSILEQISQTLFKHWFIDFEFPDEQGRPYKSSGGEFVDSELGKIPKGWKIENLANVFEFEKGIEPGSKNYFTKYDEDMVRFIRISDFSNNDNPIYIHSSLSENKNCKFDDILISLDATLGIVCVGYEGCFSSGIRKVYPKRDYSYIPKEFIYNLLKSKYIQNVINTYADGTTILHAGKSINYMKIPLPPENIFKVFDYISKCIFEERINNLRQNQTLSQIRDALLPKLITGKIRANLEDIKEG